MRLAALGVSILAIGAAAAALAATAPLSKDARSKEPFWAWGFTNLDGEKLAERAPTVDPSTSHTLGSVTMTRAQQQAAPGPVDWFPEDHKGIPTPDIVAFGSKTPRPNALDGGKPVTVTACSLCHLPNGFGRAENANVAGLPVEYFKEQINSFKTGKRDTSDPSKTNDAQMISFAQVLTDQEVQQAAEYFAKFSYAPATKDVPKWVTVQEVDSVPKFQGNGSWMVFTDPKNYAEQGVAFVKDTGSNYEALGNRIMETPRVPADQDTWRDPHSGFMAYVPVGSVAKGKQLVETGDNGRFTACTVCHGADLRGLGPFPPLAGRSPSYIARQLYDMQTGKRLGSWTPLMAPVVAALQPTDLLNISAYIASLKP